MQIVEFQIKDLICYKLALINNINIALIHHHIIFQTLCMNLVKLTIFNLSAIN